MGYSCGKIVLLGRKKNSGASPMNIKGEYRPTS
jgi:hypothetical protein